MSGASGVHACGSLRALSERLDHVFGDPQLLVEALTHSSTAGHEGAGRSNERLEFLGDRVLGLVVADLLIAAYPDESEGALARRFAALVSAGTLAQVAESLQLGDHLRLARGEEEGGGRCNPSLLADACEAVIAALYLDGGFAVAQRFVRRHWQPLAKLDLKPPKDAKSQLQEWAQGRGRPLPVYRVVAREGPEHAPRFVMEVSVDGMAPVTAEGASKRAGERAAARAMLDLLNRDGDG